MSDDTISRRAAIEAFRKELCKEHVYATPFISFKGCERILNELPSAERRGRWDNGFCSVCGAEALTEWNDTGGEYAFTKYCPNCGTKMDIVKGE